MELLVDVLAQPWCKQRPQCYRPGRKMKREETAQAGRHTGPSQKDGKLGLSWRVKEAEAMDMAPEAEIHERQA